MKQHDLIEEALTYSVIGAFYEVYNAFGYGLLERLYMNALELELRARGHRVTRATNLEVGLLLHFGPEPKLVLLHFVWVIQDVGMGFGDSMGRLRRRRIAPE